ncbi:MAG: SDR family NAD(P)-dependent oxidoreductase [Pseudomonadota bacterium]|nr:SDR family NAD(P)-dependent oxidoreductase [Pseudomonadota bacterium]
MNQRVSGINDEIIIQWHIVRDQGGDMGIPIQGENNSICQTVLDRIPQGQGKWVVLTGATDGIGKALCFALANKGFNILLCARSKTKAQSVVEVLSSHNKESSYVVQTLDLSDLRSCATAVEAIKDMNIKIDFIFANAGMIGASDAQNLIGLNETFFVNHIGHFSFITGLLPLLGTRKENRVIVQSSVAHWYHSSPYNFAKYFSATNRKQFVFANMNNAYADSKFANILFAKKLNRQLSQIGSEAMSLPVHPGYAVTNINKEIVNQTWLNSISSLFSGNNRSLLLKLGCKLKLSQPSMLNAALSALDAAFRQEPFVYTGPSGFFELQGVPGLAKLHKDANNQSLQDELWDMTASFLEKNVDV